MLQQLLSVGCSKTDRTFVSFWKQWMTQIAQISLEWPLLPSIECQLWFRATSSYVNTFKYIHGGRSEFEVKKFISFFYFNILNCLLQCSYHILSLSVCSNNWDIFSGFLDIKLNMKRSFQHWYLSQYWNNLLYTFAVCHLVV